MAKFRSQKNSFLGGEISATAQGRTDLPQFPHSCAILRNMVPIFSGGAYRRPGSFFEGELLAASFYAPRLIPFIVSHTEAYALYLTQNVGGGGTMGGFRPETNTLVSAGVSITGIPPYRYANGLHSANGFYDEWHDVQYAQSADVMTLVHPNYKPQHLIRDDVDDFHIQDFDASLSGSDLRDGYPYMPQNVTAITLAPSATLGTGITITASASFWKAGHAGALVKINHAGTIGCARIKTISSGTVATADVVVNFGATSAQPAWWESAWSDWQGWPRTTEFFQGRQIFGGGLRNPDSVWHSQANNFAVMSVAATPDPRSETGAATPFTLAISSQALEFIQWMAPDKTLVIGTSGPEWVVDRQDATAGYGSPNCFAVIQSNFGSAYHQVKRESNEILFVPGSNQEVRALIFNLIENAYHDEAVQYLYDEYPKVEAGPNADRRYRAMDWDRTRKTLWACDTAGNFFGMTRDPRLSVTAWHSHQMGGYDTAHSGGGPALGTDDFSFDPAYFSPAGSVMSTCVVPNPLLGLDDVWVCVKRFINSAYTYQFERIIGGICPYTDSFSHGIAQNASFEIGGNATYLTDASVFESTVTGETTYSGLDHLKGVAPTGTAYNVNGIFTINGSAVDNSGDTILQNNLPTGLDNNVATALVFGLPFSSIVQPVRVEAGSQIGTAQGAIKRIHEASFRFFKTMAAKVGSSSTKVFPIDFKTGSQPMGSSADLFTGDKRVKIEADYDRDGYIYILQDLPLPFAIVSVSVEGMTSDG